MRQNIFPVFTKKPSEDLMAEEHYRLCCSVAEGYRIAWCLRLPIDDTMKVNTDQAGIRNASRKRGIIVETPNDTTSVLVVNATEMNNHIAVSCLAINKVAPNIRCGSEFVHIIFGTGIVYL